MFVKRKCKNPKFVVIVCCQGQPFYYEYSNIIGALIGYASEYMKCGYCNSFKALYMHINDYIRCPYDKED